MTHTLMASLARGHMEGQSDLRLAEFRPGTPTIGWRIHVQEMVFGAQIQINAQRPAYAKQF